MELSYKELNILGHSIGIDIRKAVLSDKKKDKVFPKDFYRNYFNTGKTTIDYPVVNKLMQFGLMTQRDNADYYHVTDKGIEAFKSHFEELAIYRKPLDRNKEYLAHKINFYCDVYGYRFCQDNSKHIFEYYNKYFINKHYVSHTTKDVIVRFKTELKKLHKAELLTTAEISV